MVCFHFKSIIAETSAHIIYQRLELTTVKVSFKLCICQVMKHGGLFNFEFSEVCILKGCRSWMAALCMLFRSWNVHYF